MIKYNNANINNFNLGNDNIVKVYYGVNNTSRLPSGYTEVEYIQRDATHNGYVGLGEYFQENTKIEIDFQMTKADGFSVVGDYYNNDRDDWRIFINHHNVANNYITYDFETSRAYYVTSGWNQRFHIEIGNYYVKDLNSGNYWINSTPKTGFTRPNQMYLFYLEGTTLQANQDYGKVWKLKIWQGDTLVKDFVPCFRNSDNVVGLYDIVGNEFHGSLESTLIAGSAVTPSSMSGRLVYKKITNGSTPPTPSRLPSGYTEVEYIRHSNNVKVKNVWSVPNDAVEGNIYTVDLLLDSASQQNVSRYIGLFGWGTGYCQRTNRAAGDETNIGYRHSDGWYGDSTIGNYYQEYDVKLRYRMTPTSLAITNTQTSGVTTINLPYKDSGSGTGGNFGVFSYTGSDTGAYQMRGNIYQIIIEGSDNTIKHQYIPCQRDSDSKYGLYDLVGQEFYYPTTITISGGPAVTP